MDDTFGCTIKSVVLFVHKNNDPDIPGISLGAAAPAGYLQPGPVRNRPEIITRQVKMRRVIEPSLGPSIGCRTVPGDA